MAKPSLYDALISSDLMTASGDQANVADIVYNLACAVKGLRDAVTPVAAPGHDENGGSVSCLTEAVMGVTGGLCRIAEAISNLAEAVRETGEG